jgi:hypothetical protein
MELHHSVGDILISGTMLSVWLSLIFVDGAQARFPDRTLSAERILTSFSAINEYRRECMTPRLSQASFNDLNELFAFSCDPENLKLPPAEFRELLSKKGADKLLKENGPKGLGVRKFQESLFFFNEQNSLISSRFQASPAEPWNLSPSTPDQTCRFRAPPGSSESVRQVRFDQTRFLGVKHLSGMQEPSERDQARTQMEKDAFSSGTDAVIIEGREMGQPLGCEGVLRDAFTADSAIASVSTLMIKKAFFANVAIIPGDNQFPDPEDRKFFPSEAAFQKARRDMIFMDILSRYQGMLRKSPPIADPLGEAIRVSCQIRKYEPAPDLIIFNAQYARLNGRALPKDPREIQRDIEPASLIHQPGRTPLGTNLLKDEVEPFRNQSILRTIQLSQEHYQRPTVVFGSGHLAVIGPTLESKSKRTIQLDSKNSCP